MEELDHHDAVEISILHGNTQSANAESKPTEAMTDMLCEAVEALDLDGSPSTTESGELLKEFTVFPRLPAELRIKIWKCAIHEARCIFVSARTVAGFIQSIDNTSDIKSFTCAEPPPAILQVNQEARHEAKMYYEKFLNGIYVNPDMDTVVFSKALFKVIPTFNKNQWGTSRYRTLTAAETDLMTFFKKVRNLAMLDVMGAFSLHVSENNRSRREIISRFPNLDTVAFVLAPGGFVWTHTDLQMCSQGRVRPPKSLVKRGYAYSPTSFALCNLKAAAKGSDIWAFSELKRHAKAIKIDYELQWSSQGLAWNDEECQSVKELMTGQKNRLGNDKGPEVKVFTFCPE